MSTSVESAGFSLEELYQAHKHEVGALVILEVTQKRGPAAKERTNFYSAPLQSLILENAGESESESLLISLESVGTIHLRAADSISWVTY